MATFIPREDPWETFPEGIIELVAPTGHSVFVFKGQERVLIHETGVTYLLNWNPTFTEVVFNEVKTSLSATL